MPESASLGSFTSSAALVELSRLTGTPVRPVNGIRILRNGAEAFPAMLELLDAAKLHTSFENFIFAGDATGRRFAATLAGAAHRGVAVRVLYDPVGTMMVRGGSIAKVLRQDGVLARPFRPLSPAAPWSWLRLRHRDHRKTLVVDGETAVVGGLCISDNWSPSSRGGGGWRDTALIVQGPVVGDVQLAFEAMWLRAEEQQVLAPFFASPDPPPPPVALVAADRPGATRVSELYEWMARRARRSLEITDAYLVAPKRLLSAFREAAQRGVDVRLLLPGHTNHPMAGAAARRIYQPLLDAGVHIHEWKGVMVHAKTAVADGELTLVGSSNLDPLSMQRNYELNLVVVDPVTGKAMRDMFARDLVEATEVDPVTWRTRPWWHKLVERVATTFSRSL
jgi:cardiolipin synthase A/B